MKVRHPCSAQRHVHTFSHTRIAGRFLIRVSAPVHFFTLLPCILYPHHLISIIPGQSLLLIHRLLGTNTLLHLFRGERRATTSKYTLAATQRLVPGPFPWESSKSSSTSATVHSLIPLKYTQKFTSFSSRSPLLLEHILNHFSLALKAIPSRARCA
jgi:hypothetical protein